MTIEQLAILRHALEHYIMTWGYDRRWDNIDEVWQLLWTIASERCDKINSSI